MPSGGSFVEVAKRAFKTQGVDVTIDYAVWNDAVEAVQAGRYDGLFPMWPRSVNEYGLVASRPIGYSQLGVFSRRVERTPFTGASDLRGRLVGTVNGYRYPESITGSGLRALPSVDDLKNLHKLSAGELDFVLLERTVGEFLMASRPELKKQIRWHNPALDTVPLMVGFTAQEHAATFEKGLRELHASGVYLEILRSNSGP